MSHYRRISLAVALSLALLVHSGCQQRVKTPDMSSAEGSPKITFENTVYDFGEVSSNRKYTGQFTFTNTGNGVLKILDVSKCCGSVVALDKEELAPGENGTLKVEYTTGPRSGSMDRSIRVYSNDKTRPKADLTIKAQVVQKIDYRPERIDLLLNKENIDCPNITIRSLDDQPFSITAFQSTSNTINADIDPSVKATEFVLEPKVNLEEHQKHRRGLIAISLTHPELEKVTIGFITKERFELKPTGVFLLNPTPQEPSLNKVFVVSNYGEPFEIESTSSEKGLARVIDQQAIANGYRLEVEITPPARGQTNTFTDVLTIRLNNGETLLVKCYGRYTDAKK